MELMFCHFRCQWFGNVGTTGVCRCPQTTTGSGTSSTTGSTTGPASKLGTRIHIFTLDIECSQITISTQCGGPCPEDSTSTSVLRTPIFTHHCSAGVNGCKT